MKQVRVVALVTVFFVILSLAGACSWGWSTRYQEKNGYQNQKRGYSQNNYTQPQKSVPIQQQNNMNTINPVSQTVKKVIPYVVGISTIHTARSTAWDDTQVIEGVGSGVIVHHTGLILTNDHVAGGNPDNITVILADGAELKGRTLWSDPTLDLAIVKVNAENLPAASLGDSDQLEVGETAIAIGTPLGLQFQHTVTAGIISALNRTVQVPTERGQNFMEDLIQTDASINPGNSGGPLINMKGEVVGINTIKVTSAEGIGFAIPINVAKPIIEHFIKEGSFVTPYIGIVGFDREMARYFKQDDGIQEGVYVVDIDERGPAYKAGVRIEDIITRVGDKKVNKMLDLRSAIYSYKVGDKVNMEIIRGGRRHIVTMVLRPKPEI